jgi:hypothetical protein
VAADLVAPDRDGGALASLAEQLRRDHPATPLQVGGIGGRRRRDGGGIEARGVGTTFLAGIRHVRGSIMVVTRASPVASIVAGATASGAGRESSVDLDPARCRLVYDARAARGRNDSDFEQRVLPAFDEMAQRFVGLAP